MVVSSGDRCPFNGGLPPLRAWARKLTRTLLVARPSRVNMITLQAATQWKFWTFNGLPSCIDQAAHQREMATPNLPGALTLNLELREAWERHDQLIIRRMLAVASRLPPPSP